jgi:transcriptional regulator with XRE-family HTH domain
MDQGVGREIKRLREEKNWSMAKLAVEADMSVSGVSMIENGKRNLTTTTLAKLARALKVEVRDLFPLAQPPLDFDASELTTVEEADAEIRQWRPEAKRAIERGDVIGWTEPQEAEQTARIFAHLKDVSDRRQELDPPLATITERQGMPTEIHFLREPTLEERARLRAEYPDALEVEARETVLVW